MRVVIDCMRTNNLYDNASNRIGGGEEIPLYGAS